MKEEVIKVEREKDPGFDFTKPKRKTALLCTNGFQNADIHDATAMKEYFEANFAKDYPECEIVPVQLFHPAEPKTHRAHLYQKILEGKIREYIDKGYDIVLMGYSFSAALACKMQYRYAKHIRKLVLVAPIYDTIVNHMIEGYVRYVLKFRRLSKKYGAAVAKAMGRNTTKGMIGLLLSILRSILFCRKYYKKVTCDTIIIRGEEDELCTPHSLHKVRYKMKSRNILYSYKKMNHGILKTLRDNGPVFEDILSYAFGTPRLIETSESLVVPIVKAEKVKLDSDGNPIPTFAQIFDQLDPDSEESYAEDQKAL